MRTSDFKCDTCCYVWEVVREDFGTFPQKLKCPRCGDVNVFRKWGRIVTDTAEGKAGNSQTKYSTGIVYHPSKFGKFKGNTK